MTTGAYGVYARTTNLGVDWYFHTKAGRYSNEAQAIGQNYDLWFFNSFNGFVVGDRGYIGKTTDGGSTFDSVGIGIIPTTQRVQSICFINQDTGFVVSGSSNGLSGAIARTTDGGVSWANVYNASVSFSSVCGTSSSIVYALAESGSIYKSTDAGQNWIGSAGVVPSFMYSMSFLNNNIGFVTGNAGSISKTTDAGQTWISLSSPQTSWTFFQVKIVSETGSILLEIHPIFINLLI